MTKLTAENFDSFLASEKYVFILFDADWNNNTDLADQFQGVVEGFTKHPGAGEMAFGQVDVNDTALMDKLKEWKVANVPAMGYAYDGKPFKTVIGCGQNIKREMVEMMVLTEPLEWNKTVEKARKEYQHILDGREGRWFDPGEYEDLKQRWFDTYALRLIQSAEAYRKAIEG
jgi:hypothetical protein